MWDHSDNGAEPAVPGKTERPEAPHSHAMRPNAAVITDVY